MLKRFVVFSIVCLIVFNNTCFAASFILSPNHISSYSDSSQMVIVVPNSYKSVAATLYTYEKSGGKWKAKFSPIKAVVGVNGSSNSKIEGDGKTPVGVFSFGNFFGKTGNPGFKFPYRETTGRDYWIDDPKSKDYNTWQTYNGNARNKWNSFERLRRNDGIYDYAAVINYNTNNIIKGKGSAIFMHIWRASNKGTAGCIAMEKSNLLKVMKWLDPQKKPLLIEGPADKLKTLKF